MSFTGALSPSLWFSKMKILSPFVFISGLWLMVCGAALRAAEPVSLDLGHGTVIRFTTPAPVLWNGEKLPEPVFAADGTAEVGGLKLKRTVEKVPGGYRIQLSVTNGRAEAIELKHLVPLRVEGQANFTVAGTAIPAWQIFRISRHKNDIPGPYYPTRIDDASKDAGLDGLESKTDDPSEAKASGRRFHADPGFVVMPDGGPATSHLFIGFSGQTQHLNDVVLELNAERTALASLAAVAEFDGARLTPGATREIHPLYLQTGKDCAGLLAEHVERIRQQYGSRLADHRNVFCTWYFYGPEIVADDLRKDLAEMKRRPIAFDTFLIDYGWADDFGDWTAMPERFPQGMKAMADEIHAAGMSAGIWTAPFLVAPDAEVLKKYPDLLLKTRAGKNVEFAMPNIGKGRFFVVDPTAPSAPQFLAELCQRLRGWGYDYLKFDFLRGIVTRDDEAFHDPAMDRAQVYRRAMEILRRAAGDDAMIGAWGGLYEANAGIVNINRSGSDVRGHWDPVLNYNYGTRYEVRMRQTFARSFYDEKLFTSDQDALQLRRRDTAWRKAKPHLAMGVFTDEEAFSTVVYRFLGGGVVQVSDKLDEVPQDRYDLYKAVIPTYAPVAQVFNGWKEYVPEFFVSHFAATRDLPAWAVVTLCNWNGVGKDAAAKSLAFRVSDVPGLPKAEAYAAFEFRTQKLLGVYHASDEIRLELPVHGARVIRLTPLAGAGTYLVGTDLNLAAGMEIESVREKHVTLKPAERAFPAKVTFLKWNDGKAEVETVRVGGK